MANASPGFIALIRELLDRLAASQEHALGAAAELMADALASDRLVHLFGAGHGALPVMDAFPRFGGYVGLNPLLDPRLLWFDVVGRGGVRELTWLERAEGYVGEYLAGEPLVAGDVLVVFSHDGRKVAPLEAAQYARSRGVSVVAVLSRATLAGPTLHSSGSTLAAVADVVIDTGAPAADAVVEVAGWQAPVAASSSMLAGACLGEVVSRTAALLATRGISLPILEYPAGEASAVEANERVFAAHRRRLAEAWLVAAGGGRT